VFDQFSLVRNSLQMSLDGGWEWQLDCTESLTGERKRHAYHTNSHNAGLWCDERQIEGTCQFQLSDYKDRAKQQIRRYFARNFLVR
jgi:hypothetical protein